MLKTGLVILAVVTLTAGLFFAAVQRSVAGTLLFNRGLPTTNLNNAAGTDQSNVSWADTESSSNPSQYYLPGDDFTLPTNAAVNDIRVWIVGAGDTAPGGLPSGLSLLGGEAGGPMSTISSTYMSTAVTYADGELYQSGSGAYWNIYQVDFKVNQSLAANETYDFFVDQPFVSGGGGNYYNAFLHASNASLSGSPQQGANGQFLWLNVDNTSQTVETWYSGTGEGTAGMPAGWNKNSDANVQVYGTAVPEPSSILLLGFGLFGLAVFKMRFRAA